MTQSYNNNYEVFGPLRVSESHSTTRKAATVEKVMESVNQAVSSSHIWSESIINKSLGGFHLARQNLMERTGLDLMCIVMIRQ